MHFAFVSAALFGASASASTLFARQDVVVSPCVIDGDLRLDDFSATDHSCICKNTAYINSVIECVKETCTSADLYAALEAVRELCQLFGVTLPAVFIESATTSAAVVYGSASARTTDSASSTTHYYAATVSSTAGAPAATAAGSVTVDF